jgi:hypothetical protein
MEETPTSFLIPLSSILIPLSSVLTPPSSVLIPHYSPVRAAPLGQPGMSHEEPPAHALHRLILANEPLLQERVQFQQPGLHHVGTDNSEFRMQRPECRASGLSDFWFLVSDFYVIRLSMPPVSRLPSFLPGIMLKTGTRVRAPALSTRSIALSGN